jgi:hypothetical protein
MFKLNTATVPTGKLGFGRSKSELELTIIGISKTGDVSQIEALKEAINIALHEAVSKIASTTILIENNRQRDIRNGTLRKFQSAIECKLWLRLNRAEKKQDALTNGLRELQLVSIQGGL